MLKSIATVQTRRLDGHLLRRGPQPALRHHEKSDLGILGTTGYLPTAKGRAGLLQDIVDDTPMDAPDHHKEQIVLCNTAFT